MPITTITIIMPAHTITPLDSATASSTGGRNGRTEASDGSLSVNLSLRKAMGGPGLPGTTTPEHLFAAGYAACFNGSLEYLAGLHKKDVTGCVVTCTTSIGPREGGGFGLAIRMHVKVPTLSTAEAEALANEVHEKACPYSHATRGNVDFELVTEGAS